MKNVLWNSMQALNNATTTTNGDKAFKSSLNPLVDLLFKASSLRHVEDIEICKIFSKALSEDVVKATVLAFYIRDIRGGQGERNVFRVSMTYLAYAYPEIFKQVFSYIPEYGRWDDIIYLLTNIENEELKSSIIDLIRLQLTDDIESIEDSVSLLGKWMPSENASSYESKKTAKYLAKALQLTYKEYRQMLSILRKKIDIVETKIASGKFSEIDYSAVPSKAMMKYRHIFLSKDTNNFKSYLSKLSKPEENPEVKVNAGTLYPFDIVSKFFNWGPVPENELLDLYDAQWKALPDFFEGKFDNALVIADTSGSMTGNPINVCLGLAIYIAERNKGLFHNKFITFSNEPELQEIFGKNIAEKCNNLGRANWDMNTDIEKVYKLILESAITNNLSQEDLPSTLYIISDMQFDCCKNGENVSVYEKYKNQFEEHRYTLPNIVFWNVSEDCHSSFPVTSTENGTILCSGYSPAIIKFIMDSQEFNSDELINTVVYAKRYENILNKLTN